jgi:uncharacterized protein YcbK (DUF882 family)
MLAGQLTTDFNAAEFACGDGTVVPDHLMKNVRTLANNLQVLRDVIGMPITINSGYRTDAHNKAIGGATNSQHLLAKAADIVVAGWNPSDVQKQIEALIKGGQMTAGGVGLHENFVHYDIRGTNVRW